ncbi:MAG: enolase C-terminal domain-like protein [Verrucomicrobiota bacterium]
MMNRRHFLKSSAAVAAPSFGLAAAQDEELGRVTERPVFDMSALADPVIIKSIDLLRAGREYMIRVRSEEGAESVTFANPTRMRYTEELLLQRVIPSFVGQDARRLESLLFEVYRASSNYKLQGLLFWSCVAAVEAGVIDLLGQISKRSIGDLFGGVKRRSIPVYRASSNRGNTPEAEIHHLRKLVAGTGVKALKWRAGGRMSKNRDEPPGRTEALIPLVRETFGDDFTIYADSNSSYDVAEAVRIGRLMEEQNYAFFEEPCPFDDLWSTREVTRQLQIPIAGGEQEFSMRRFRWAIENEVMDIAQPDLVYFGGFIRCAKVAALAKQRDMPCTVHMSGSGLGFVKAVHFASFVDDPGDYQEFKGESNLPVEVEGSDLRCHDGVIQVPTGPGFGVTIDPDYVDKAQRVG